MRLKRVEYAWMRLKSNEKLKFNSIEFETENFFLCPHTTFCVHTRHFCVHTRHFFVHTRYFFVHTRHFFVHTRHYFVHTRHFVSTHDTFVSTHDTFVVHTRHYFVHTRHFVSTHDTFLSTHDINLIPYISCLFLHGILEYLYSAYAPAFFFFTSIWNHCCRYFLVIRCLLLISLHKSKSGTIYFIVCLSCYVLRFDLIILSLHIKDWLLSWQRCRIFVCLMGSNLLFFLCAYCSVCVVRICAVEKS